jgi:hypothetical protein
MAMTKPPARQRIEFHTMAEKRPRQKNNTNRYLPTSVTLEYGGNAVKLAVVPSHRIFKN